MLILRPKGNMLPTGILYNRTITIIGNVHYWTLVVIFESRILNIKNIVHS